MNLVLSNVEETIHIVDVDQQGQALPTRVRTVPCRALGAVELIDPFRSNAGILTCCLLEETVSSWSVCPLVRRPLLTWDNRSHRPNSPSVV